MEDGLGREVLIDCVLLLFGWEHGCEYLCRNGIGNSSKFLLELKGSRESSSSNSEAAAFVSLLLGQWRRNFERLTLTELDFLLCGELAESELLSSFEQEYDSTLA